MTLAVIWMPAGPLPLRLTVPEIALAAFVLAFLVWQLVRGALRSRVDWFWLILGFGLYAALATEMDFALTSPWQSLLLLGFVALNVWLVFGADYVSRPRLIFFDMTLCFLTSFVLIPGQGLAWMVPLDDWGRRIQDVRDPLTICLNTVVFLVISLAYVAASRSGRLDTEPKWSVRDELLRRRLGVRKGRIAALPLAS